MAKLSKSEYREVVRQMFLKQYIPRLRVAIDVYMEQEDRAIEMMMEVSEIVGQPVATDVAVLAIAQPTNDLIDMLADLYEKTQE